MRKLLCILLLSACPAIAGLCADAITGLPVPCVGGAGNLTTVGSVPYVSASGILNQDAGQFFWDATNNRLGIGTATPSTPLHIQTTTGYGLRLTGAGITGGSDSANGAGINLSYNAVGNRQFWIGDTSTNFGIRLINSQMDGFDLAGGTSRAMALQVNGNPLSIGTGATGYSLQVYGNSALNSSGVFNAASSAGASYLMVNNTGNVGIGTTTPVSAIEVQGAVLATFINNPIISSITSTTAFAAGMGAGIQFSGKWNASGASTTFAYIGGVKENATDGNYDGKLVFGTRQNLSAGNDMTKMTILASGNVGIGYTAPTAKMFVSGDIIVTAGNNPNVDGVVGVIRGDNGNYGTGGAIQISASTTAANQYIAFGTTVSGATGLAAVTEKMRITGTGNVGIGTTTPANQLDIATLVNSGFGLGYDSTTGILPTLKFYRYAGGASTIGAYQLVVGETGASAGSDLSFKSGGYAARGSETLTTKVTFTNTGNVGIGTTTPTQSLHIWNSSTAAARIQTTGNASASFLFSRPNREFYVGVGPCTATDSFNICDATASAVRLLIDSTGNVGIGTTTPSYLLDVAKSGASGTARFYDQTATTGATRVLITLGAADTTSTQVFEIGGLMKFSGSNSTGAGTALLGTNSPAVTNTAPYTWLKVLTSDGSTAYVPAWK